MSRGDFPSSKQDQFMIRFPDGMREEIRRLAQEDHMSMNAKIVQMLDFAIQNSGLDIDAIFRILADQRVEVRKLSTQIENTNGENAQRGLLTEADLQAIQKIVRETISEANDQ